MAPERERAPAADVPAEPSTAAGRGSVAPGQSVGWLGWRWLQALGSLKLTLFVMAALGAGVLWAYQSEVRTSWALAAPLGLFALNLLAAIATRPVFRSQMALLVFHLALLELIVLVAVGRLTYLDGRVEVAQGQWFSGELFFAEAGPWHPWHLKDVAFTNDGFTIDYAPGVRRGATRNQVSWRDGQGRLRRAVVGDQVPLVIDGYRFYTTPNKGFAPLFTWQPQAGGAPVTGAVHLPSYPISALRQSQEWQPPGSASKVWVMLEFDEVIIDPEQASEFRLPTEHRLVVRTDAARHVLVPGDALALADGLLVYQGLGTWMGYKVFYDWTIPWLLSACLLAVASLAWHYRRKFAARPWRSAIP